MVSAIGLPALSSTIRLVWPKLLPVRISVCGSWMVTSAMPGLPMITVAAAALMRSTRAMLTLTLMGAPSAAMAGAGVRLDASDRLMAKAAASMGRMNMFRRYWYSSPYFPPEWFTFGKRKVPAQKVWQSKQSTMLTILVAGWLQVFFRREYLLYFPYYTGCT
ncbi:hypothetical protein D9M68_820730 [compost metagenome]